jgi:hypothetical protein
MPLGIAAVYALPDKKILRFLSSDLQWQWVYSTHQKEAHRAQTIAS